MQRWAGTDLHPSHFLEGSWMCWKRNPHIVEKLEVRLTSGAVNILNFTTSLWGRHGRSTLSCFCLWIDIVTEIIPNICLPLQFTWEWQETTRISFAVENYKHLITCGASPATQLSKGPLMQNHPNTYTKYYRTKIASCHGFHGEIRLSWEVSFHYWPLDFKAPGIHHELTFIFCIIYLIFFYSEVA